MLLVLTTVIFHFELFFQSILHVQLSDDADHCFHFLEPYDLVILGHVELTRANVVTLCHIKLFC